MAVSRPLVDIRLDALSTRGGKPPGLDQISVHVRYGEFFTFLGPPHSGKTDVLKAVAGFMPVSHGRILVDGQDIAGLAPGRRSTGYVFQDGALWAHMTVRQHVAFGLEQQAMSAADIERQVGLVLGRLGLAGCADKRPPALDLGERRRLALARALAVEPRVLLLDEPFGALDANVRAELRAWLRRLHDRVPVTTVLVTHDQEEAMEVADRIAVLREGRLEQVGAPRELYERPANDFVMGFLGPVSQLDGALVRPHDLIVLDRPEDGAAEAMVMRVVHLGFEVRAELVLADGDEVSVQLTRTEADALELKAGEIVWVSGSSTPRGLSRAA